MVLTSQNTDIDCVLIQANIVILQGICYSNFYFIYLIAFVIPFYKRPHT